MGADLVQPLILVVIAFALTVTAILMVARRDDSWAKKAYDAMTEHKLEVNKRFDIHKINVSDFMKKGFEDEEKARIDSLTREAVARSLEIDKQFKSYKSIMDKAFDNLLERVSYNHQNGKLESEKTLQRQNATDLDLQNLKAKHKRLVSLVLKMRRESLPKRIELEIKDGKPPGPGKRLKKGAVASQLTN